MDQPPSIASPEDLLALLQQDGAGQQPELQELMSAVQRMQSGQPAARADADQVLVFPEPGFVIKTQDEQGSKVFINVCGSDKVALPGGWEGGKVPEDVKRYLEAPLGLSGSEVLGEGAAGGAGGEAAELLRFPLSMGQLRADEDHCGVRCTVIDCIFSDELLRMAGAYRPLKAYLISLVLNWAQQKNGLALNPHYKLPKMRYKGDAPPPQYVRQDKRQQPQQQRLISEVEDDSPTFALRAEPAASGGGEGRKPQQQQQAMQQAQQLAGGAAVQQSGKERGTRQAAAHSHDPASTASPVGPAAEAPRQAAAAAAPRGAQAQAAALAGQLPGQQLGYALEYIGRPVEAVQLAVQLPPTVVQSLGSISTTAAQQQGAQQQPGTAGIAVDVAGHSVYIAAPGCAELAVQLPFAVAAEGASAQLEEGRGQLLLRLPHLPFRNVYNKLRQAAPGKPATPGLTTSSLLDVD